MITVQNFQETAEIALLWLTLVGCPISDSDDDKGGEGWNAKDRPPYP